MRDYSRLADKPRSESFGQTIPFEQPFWADSVLRDRYTANRNQQSFREWDLHNHPRRRIVREEFGEKAVEFSKVRDIGHEHCGIYHQIEATASSPKNRIKILECLLRLNLEAGTGRFAAGREHAWLTSNEQHPRALERHRWLWTEISNHLT